jgi:hypothetical protein
LDFVLDVFVRLCASLCVFVPNIVSFHPAIYSPKDENVSQGRTCQWQSGSPALSMVVCSARTGAGSFPPGLDRTLTARTQRFLSGVLPQ